MKNNQLIAALVGILFLCSLSTAYLTWKYRSSMNELQDIQGKAAYVNTYRPILESLLNDTIEYSKKNPAIGPLLYSVTNRAKAAAPAAKPATK